MSKIRRCSFIALLPFAWGFAQAQDPDNPVEAPGTLEQTVPVADDAAAANDPPPADTDSPGSEDVLREYACSQNRITTRLTSPRSA